MAADGHKDVIWTHGDKMQTKKAAEHRKRSRSRSRGANRDSASGSGHQHKPPLFQQPPLPPPFLPPPSTPDETHMVTTGRFSVDSDRHRRHHQAILGNTGPMAMPSHGPWPWHGCMAMAIGPLPMDGPWPMAMGWAWAAVVMGLMAYSQGHIYIYIQENP